MTAQLPPRNTLAGTRAESLLQRDFYRTYLQARYLPGEDRELPNADAVFTSEGVQRLRRYLTDNALYTPLVFTERLSNRVLAILLVQNGVERYVVLNTRFKVDPDVLAHTLIEEYVHSQQVLDQQDFERQKEQFAYAQRPYETEAKRIATDVLGYDPSDYETYLIREEPSLSLYDVR